MQGTQWSSASEVTGEEESTGEALFALLTACYLNTCLFSLLTTHSFASMYTGTQTSNERLPHVCPAEATSITEGESRYVQC